jgi:hypothetical protein
MASTPIVAAPFARRLARACANLRVADLVVLAIVGGCVLNASAKLVSTPHPLLQLVLVIGCTSAAAKRLVAWRHGRCQPISIEGPAQTIAVVAGVTPWFLLTGFDQPLHLSASLLVGVSVTAWLAMRWCADRAQRTVPASFVAGPTEAHMRGAAA